MHVFVPVPLLVLVPVISPVLISVSVLCPVPDTVPPSVLVAATVPVTAPVYPAIPAMCIRFVTCIGQFVLCRLSFFKLVQVCIFLF